MTSKTHSRKILISLLSYAGVFGYLCATLFGIDSVVKHCHLRLSVAEMFGIECVVLLALVLILSVAYGLIFRKRSFELIKRLATLPGRHNYNWQGGYSVFSYVLLYAITWLRAISCLQLCKQLYRKLISSGKDLNSKRPNVSPLFQEFYFLIWAGFLIGQLYGFCRNSFWIWVDVYFLIESFTWVLYYSVFRRFYEENYSIYHVLEHLPLVLFMMPLQAISYAMIIDTQNSIIGWKLVLTVLLGQATENRIVFSFIGFIYSAIVISMILSMFPPENIKRGNPDTLIIGFGDVVRNRLLPAYLKREQSILSNKRGKLEIYDLKENVKIYENIV